VGHLSKAFCLRQMNFLRTGNAHPSIRPPGAASHYYRHSLSLFARRIVIQCTFAFAAFTFVSCGQIPDPVPTGSTTDVESFGFSILVDTSLVLNGWTVREFEYAPSRPQRFRSVSRGQAERSRGEPLLTVIPRLSGCSWTKART